MAPLRRFDHHSIELATREGWSTVRVRDARLTGPRHDWDDHALLCVDLDDVLGRVRALAAIPGLRRVEFGLYDLTRREMTACLELLSTVPELVVTLIGTEQLHALPALSDAVELRLMLGRSDKVQWFTALEALWPTLARMPGLGCLRMAGGPLDARLLGRLGALRELELNTVDLTNVRALRGLQLSRFTGWCLADPQVVLAELAAMGSLLELSLRRCALDDDALPIVARSSRLEVLRLPSNLIEGAGLAALADLPLHTLELSSNPIGALQHLPPLRSLRALDLHSVDLRGQSCGVLAGMERLVELNLERCRVGQGVTPLIGRMQALQVLKVGSCDLVDAGFVSGLRRLRILDLENNELKGLVAEELRPLSELRDLSLRHTRFLGVGAVSALSELPNLSALALGLCDLLPDHLRALSRSTSLRRLEICFNDVGDVGMRALAPLVDLATLDVGHCRVGDTGAATIARSLGNLRQLDIADNLLSDVGADAVMGLGRLLWLNVRSNYIGRTDLVLSGGRLWGDEQRDGRPPRVLQPCFFTEVNEQLERAFDGVPVPQPPSRTLYQAQAEDNYETCDRSRDHLGRWQDLPHKHLADCTCALSYLDAHGVRYYVPAMIRAELDNRLEPTGSYDHLEGGIGFHMTPGSSNSLRSYDHERFALLDVHQRAAIAAWVGATQEDADITEAWRRVVHFDATGSPGDWFDAFWPPIADDGA